MRSVVAIVGYLTLPQTRKFDRPMLTVNLRTIIFVGFFLRLIIAAWNGFWGPSFGAGIDAFGFHLAAIAYSSNLVLDEFVIGHFYSYVLGIIYFLTTDSLFLGSLLSSVAWVASAFVLVWVTRMLSFDKSHQFKAMLVYALLPSSILLTSVTLREPYQLLFVNLAVYSALKIYLKKSYVHWLLLFCAAAGMGVLHGVLFAFGVFIVVATLILLAFRGRVGISLAKLIFAAPIIALIVFYGLSLFTSVSYNLDEGLAAVVQSYQEGGLSIDARTHYKDSVEINGVAGLLLFVPVSLLQYLFEPMPWRISAASDVAALFENIMRAWLIWKACVGLRKMPAQGRRPVLFVFVSYLVIETIWSLGTINWGTAARHHIPSVGLLVIAAFAYSGKKLTKRAKSLDTSFKVAAI